MSLYRAEPIESESPSEIAIRILEQGKPVEVLRESLPEGFPPELGRHLADFMARGFNTGCSRQSDCLPDLSAFAEPLHGRPIESDVQQIGQQAAKLRLDGLTYGQIARQVCPELRKDSRHHCDRKCADRIRQAAQPYLKTAKARSARTEKIDD